MRRRTVTVALLALLAPLCWLTIIAPTPAEGALRPTMSTHVTPAHASTPATTHDSGHDPRHKEGPLAVAASVIGIIVVVSFVVGLGSISVRRRTRDRPSSGGGGQSGPPGSNRGPFDEWFRPRR